MNIINGDLTILKKLIFIALKYLRGKNSFFFQPSNQFCLFGIAIGVFSILVVSSFMDGLKVELLKQIIDNKPHIIIQKKDNGSFKDFDKEYLKKRFNNITAISSVVETEVIVQNKTNINIVTLLGIDLNHHSQITKFLNNYTLEEFDNKSLIIGGNIAFNLDVKVDDIVTLFSTSPKIPTAFGLIPIMKKVKIKNIFFSSDPKLNSFTAYTSKPVANIFQPVMGEVNKIYIKTANSQNSHLTAKKLHNYFGDEYLVSDWSKLEINLFKSLKVEKIALNFVLSLIVILAVFNMGSNFVKLTLEKKTEIGVLKAIGYSNFQIYSVFYLIGSIIGFLGATLGSVVAFVFIFMQKIFGIIPIPVEGLSFSSVPVELKLSEFVILFALVMAVSFATSTLPAMATRKIDPIRIIRDL